MYTIKYISIYTSEATRFFTYDHRTLKTRLPVRSALFKQRTGGLVVRWVTTSEYPLLYVFVFLQGNQQATMLKAETSVTLPQGKYQVVEKRAGETAASLIYGESRDGVVHLIYSETQFNRALC